MWTSYQKPGYCISFSRVEQSRAPLAGYARSVFDYPQNGLRRFSAATPRQTVRAGFPHTALRVGLVSSVSLPFAPRLRFTLIPMDAPPYGRAVSDAPPHSGLSPIAVFRHYCSRHLICIVLFTRRGPSLHGHCPVSPLLWPRPTPRFAFAIARPPKFLTELSMRVVRLCPAAPARPKPIRAHGVGFTASELLAARNSSNETLRRRFICITYPLAVGL